MKIKVIDDQPPETIAMMQALYSRSPKSVEEHLEKVQQVGSDKFMQNFYVGYGHKSIGDCGTTTIFIEGVSMLAAKAIQDWGLYSGQEASTRYMDFKESKCIDPLDCGGIQERWMQFYNDSFEDLSAYLIVKHANAKIDDNAFPKAIRARTFDILRAFIPAGMTTNLSWHTNLRQAIDHLQLLRCHPLPEVRSIAGQILVELIVHYPSSFSNHKVTSDQLVYRSALMEKSYNDETPIKLGFMGTVIRNTGIDFQHNMGWLLKERPPKTEFPAWTEELASYCFEFPLDFGSFRDLQRHRNGVCRMPILRTSLGFHPWYLNQLPDNLGIKAAELLRQQELALTGIGEHHLQKQYYVAMGYRVPCRVTYPLPAAVYVAELRSGQTVHPTFRAVAQEMGRFIEKTMPSIKMYCDYSEDVWSERRGNQDITEKNK